MVVFYGNIRNERAVLLKNILEEPIMADLSLHFQFKSPIVRYGTRVPAFP
jgi:hypothetical protein